MKVGVSECFGRGLVGVGLKLGGGDLEPTFAATAIALETRRPLLSILVVNMPNLVTETKCTRLSTFSCSEGWCRFFSL